MGLVRVCFEEVVCLSLSLPHPPHLTFISRGLARLVGERGGGVVPSDLHT